MTEESDYIVTEDEDEENCWEPYIVKCIMDYSYCQTQVTECCIDTYHSYSPIRQCVNGLASIQYSVLSQCYFIEPEYENWLAIVYINSEGKLKEEYTEIGELSFDVISLAQRLMHIYRKNNSAFSLLKIKGEYFINFHNTFYTIFFIGLNRRFQENGIENTVETNMKCKYTFLSITYKTENNKTGIPIDLDRGYYMNMNIILTPAFILRELSYRNNSKEFNADYTVEIMDHNLEIVTIHPDEYILLEKDNYKVLHIESDYNESIVSEDIGMEII